MFDANMRHLSKGHHFIAKVGGLKQKSPLYKVGVKTGDLLLCTMLEDDHDNPRVMLHFPDQEDLVLISHGDTLESMYQHPVFYFGTVKENGELVDFLSEDDLEYAKNLMKSFKGWV